MSRPVLVDTGPLYALADRSGQYHSRAKKELRRLLFQDRHVAVTYPTLSEAYTLVLRRLGSAYALQWIAEVMDGSMLVNPEAADYQAAATLLAAFPDKPLTLFDAVAAVVSTRMQCPMWTFDRHFEFLRVDRWK